jgi:hypothetical protein
MRTLAVAALAVGLLQLSPASAGKVELEAMMTQLEGKVRDISNQAELWQSRRCDDSVVGQAACQNKNYHCCGSKLPQPVCEDGSQTPECGVACGSVRDYSTSTVSLFGVNQREQGFLPDITKETVCWCGPGRHSDPAQPTALRVAAPST